MRKPGIIFCLTLVIVACQKQVLPPEPKANDQWTYRFTTYDESGNIVDTIDKNYTAHGYDKETTKYVEQWISVKQDGSTAQTGFPCTDYRLRDDGLYYLTNASLGGIPTKYFPYPATVGQTFTHYYSSEFVSSTTVLSVDDTLTVPYGFFSNLYKYKQVNSEGVTNNFWFNDSTWFVKYEITNSLTSGTGTYVSQSIELVNYTAQ